MKSCHISCVIHASPDLVYEVVADPNQLSRWGEGLARAAVSRDGDDLIVASPMGEVRVRFAPRNDYGVADHDVTTIFYEEAVSDKYAATVAKETGASTAVLNPLEMKPESGDYLSVMRTNLTELRAALGCS